MNIDKTAKMIGDYNPNKVKLNTDKIVGNVTACIGFVRSKEYPRFFVPNTVLREDIRNVIQKPVKRILATYKKTRDEHKYSSCTYMAKNITLDDIMTFSNVKTKLKEL